MPFATVRVLGCAGSIAAGSHSHLDHVLAIGMLADSVAVHITHIKPGEVAAVMAQIQALGSRHRISALASGQVMTLGGR